MNPRRLERWKRHRKVGRAHFIIRRAMVLGLYGGVAGFFVAGDMRGARINPWLMGSVFATMGLLGGFLAGWTTWLANEREFALAANSCTNCGYSLTGNTSGRCPECGQSVR